MVFARKAKPWAKLGRYNRTSDTNGIYSIGCVCTCTCRVFMYTSHVAGCVHVLITHVVVFIVRVRVCPCGCWGRDRQTAPSSVVRRAECRRSKIAYLEPVAVHIHARCARPMTPPRMDHRDGGAG